MFVYLRFRELREERLMNAQTLAEQAGISSATIRKVEAGQKRTNVNTARRIAQVLGVALEDIVVREPAAIT